MNAQGSVLAYRALDKAGLPIECVRVTRGQPECFYKRKLTDAEQVQADQILAAGGTWEVVDPIDTARETLREVGAKELADITALDQKRVIKALAILHG